MITDMLLEIACCAWSPTASSPHRDRRTSSRASAAMNLPFSLTTLTVTAIGQRLIASLCNPISTDRASHQVGVSIGAALIPDDGIVVEEIMADADFAMYQAKAQNQSAMVFCQGSLAKQQLSRA